nr:hypothetical protein [Providencia sp.]
MRPKKSQDKHLLEGSPTIPASILSLPIGTEKVDLLAGLLVITLNIILPSPIN